MKKAGIVGVGLIGGSIAAGLEKAGWTVVGYDADPEVGRIAVEAGLVTSLVESIDSIANESFDVLIVAAPPEATVEILSGLTTSIPVMDVAGVKTLVAMAAVHLESFVGTHPMAGRETAGPKAASAALFNGASWVVIDGASPSADRVATEVIETLGARVVRMSAVTHDAAVGRISHLPQIVAGALLASVADTEGAMDLAAGSFRDLTRVAASLPVPWVEVLKANSQAVLDGVGALKLQLSALEAAVVSDDDSLLNLLIAAGESRRALGAPVVAVRVALADTPGEIAKVGHALEISKVDVRDIQMRHAPYGGGGVLTVSVRPGEEGTLAQALEAAGLLLVP